MTVPRDHHAESGSLGLQIQLRQIVQDVNRRTAEFDYFGLRESASPGALIDVAANRRERRDCYQGFENFGITDIAGMNNVVRAAQGLNRFRPEQAVRIRNDADKNGSPQLFRVLPISWFISA